jgi:integrase
MRAPRGVQGAGPVAKGDRAGGGRPRKRVPNGAGSLYCDVANQCWVGSVSLGEFPGGRRNRPSVRDHDFRTAQAKLLELQAEIEAGGKVGGKYTVQAAADDFLKHQEARKFVKGTVEELHCHVRRWIVPGLGHAKLKQLTTDDVDAWLQTMVPHLSTSAIRRRLETLRRIIPLAQAHGWVQQNVAALADAPQGTEGRPSKSFTLDRDRAVLRASLGHPIHAYIALTLLAGVLPEEARPLTWNHTHLNPPAGQVCSCGVEHREDLPPHVEVWHSVRSGGDTKTPKSRRTVALPEYVITALAEHRTAAPVAGRARVEVRRHRVRLRHTLRHASEGTGHPGPVPLDHRQGRP